MAGSARIFLKPPDGDFNEMTASVRQETHFWGPVEVLPDVLHDAVGEEPYRLKLDIHRGVYAEVTKFVPT